MDLGRRGDQLLRQPDASVLHRVAGCWGHSRLDCAERVPDDQPSVRPDGGPPPAAFGPAHAEFNWCYDYCQSYNTVIPAKLESTGTGFNGTIPCIWGDGYYIDTGTTGGTTNRHLERNNIWWALSSGASGFSIGDGPIYRWD